MRFHFVNVVWGEEYTRTCVEVMLPALLSSGNLAHSALAGNARFLFYTTPADAERIAASSAFRRLSQLMEVEMLDLTEFRKVTGSAGMAKYRLMNACQGHAVLRANEANAAIVFLCPDLMVSDNLCKRLIELADEGRTVVYVAGARLCLDGIQRELGERFAGAERAEYPGIAPREMVRIALRTLSRNSRSLFWDAADVTIRPNHLWWRVGEAGFFVRGFHLHPILVAPTVPGIIPVQSQDDDFVERACPDLSRYYFIGDSDECSAFSMGPDDEFPLYQTPGRYSEEAIAAYVMGQPDIRPLHRRFPRHVLRFHAEDLDETWASVEAESSQILSRIYRLIAANEPRGFSHAQWTDIFHSRLRAGTGT